jgi:predicted Na+-dependent transporter
MASFFVEVLSAILLYSLVFGMTATVEISHMRKQAHNSVALLIGASIQFLILPFVGFLTVQIFRLPTKVGITLLVITSSPGGSYSNWWCSMFNADLALSVTMTALSTLLATVMLPAN